MINRTNFLGLLLLISALSGCGGNGDNSPNAQNGEFDGFWNVRLSFTSDECQIVENSDLGVLDLQNITVSNDIVVAQSSLSFGEGFIGAITERSAKFIVGEDAEGDLFGDGFFCVVSQAFSYEATDANSAAVVFARELACEDGYTCSSQGFGTASRG